MKLTSVLSALMIFKQRMPEHLFIVAGTEAWFRVICFSIGLSPNHHKVHWINPVNYNRKLLGLETPTIYAEMPALKAFPSDFIPILISRNGRTINKKQATELAIYWNSLKD